MHPEVRPVPQIIQTYNWLQFSSYFTSVISLSLFLSLSLSVFLSFCLSVLLSCYLPRFLSFLLFSSFSFFFSFSIFFLSLSHLRIKIWKTIVYRLIEKFFFSRGMTCFYSACLSLSMYLFLFLTHIHMYVRNYSLYTVQYAQSYHTAPPPKKKIHDEKCKKIYIIFLLNFGKLNKEILREKFDICETEDDILRSPYYHMLALRCFILYWSVHLYTAGEFILLWPDPSIYDR